MVMVGSGFLIPPFGGAGGGGGGQFVGDGGGGGGGGCCVCPSWPSQGTPFIVHVIAHCDCWAGLAAVRTQHTADKSVLKDQAIGHAERRTGGGPAG